MTEEHQQFTRQREFWNGAKDMIPLEIGAIPLGIIFGALAVGNGLSSGGALGMSAFVFAGSAQFVAAQLIKGQASIAIIVFTTFIINVRHALYSATLAPHMKHLPQRWLIPLAFWLTDETFVIVISRYNKPDNSPYKHWYYFGSALFMYLNWQFCTIIGIVLGQSANAENWGLDFALVATFTGMLIPLVFGRAAFVSVIVAGISSVVAQQFLEANQLPVQLALIIAAILGIVSGVLAEQYFGEPEQKPISQELKTS